MKKKVILIVGTRPEAIKMIPVYHALRKAGIPALLCSTGQHAEMLNQVFSLFGVVPDFDLKIMEPRQSLFYITKSVLEKTEKLFKKLTPSLILVQGDTSSAMTAAMAAFYLRIPVVHIEAGLRSGNINRPFPEELNRKIITLLASYHCAPTQLAASRLLREGIKKENLIYTGNTVVDALFEIKKKIKTGQLKTSTLLKKKINHIHRLRNRILSLNEDLYNIFSSIKAALQCYPHLHIVYPSHLNPMIQNILKETDLGSAPNISIFPPLPYQDIVYLLTQVHGVLTDSGGIQEEAISLGKPVLVLRNETDRPEGKAILVGTRPNRILQGIKKFMEMDMTNPKIRFVYGDGRASNRIVKLIKNVLKHPDFQ